MQSDLDMSHEKMSDFHFHCLGSLSHKTERFRF